MSTQLPASEPVSTEEDAWLALAGRREQALLLDASVLAVARLLVRRCRGPHPWVRAAVGTLDRFAKEVAYGDLPGLLAAGVADPEEADRSLQRLARRHDGLAASQLASLAFGPKLWWTAAGVPVSWRPLSHAVGARPLPSAQDGVRALLLSVIGSGATEQELRAVRVGDVGSLDAMGGIVPDLQAEPLAVAYRDLTTGTDHVTFMSYEGRAVLLELLAARGPQQPDAPLLAPEDVDAAAPLARASGSALIGAGNDVNVTMCRATGDFFRAWGMPGARFDTRSATSEEDQ